MAVPKKGDLSKGIRSLLQNMNSDLKVNESDLKTALAPPTTITRIAIEKIETNPKQPRLHFDETALQELATSIKQYDIIQPITVSLIGNGKYRLISGERRLRASKIAGLKDLPAYIRTHKDKEILEIALVENIQREDLNAIEIATTYQRLTEELHYSVEILADKLGKNRSTITNFLRLLKLPPTIQQAVREQHITMGHARCLIAIEGIEKQLSLFNEIKKNQLSVRQAEHLVRKFQQHKPTQIEASSKTKNENNVYYKKIESKLSNQFSTAVILKNTVKGSGEIILHYSSIQALNAILKKMGVGVD